MNKLIVLCACLMLTGCSKTKSSPSEVPKAPESAAQQASTPKASPTKGAETTKGETKGTPADAVPAATAPILAADANTAQDASDEVDDGSAIAAAGNPWPVAPKPVDELRCQWSDCECGDGACPENAWCIHGKCYIGNSPMANRRAIDREEDRDEYSIASIRDSYMYNTDKYIQTNLMGNYRWEIMDGSFAFSCQSYEEKCEPGEDGDSEECEEFCTLPDGVILNRGEFITEDGSLLRNTIIHFDPFNDDCNEDLLTLCGRKSAESLRRDLAPFDAFVQNLAQKSLPDHCSKQGNTQPDDEDDEDFTVYKDCIRTSKRSVDHCEIREFCDPWYIPKANRDEYVCEFRPHVATGEAREDFYFYPRPFGPRCVKDGGCVCTTQKIAKGEYCNGIPGKQPPK